MVYPTSQGREGGTAEEDKMDPENEVGQEEVTEEVTDNSSQETQTETAETEGGFNPAWNPIRDHLGIAFEGIKPELAKIDRSYHDHITKVNGQYSPWKALDEQGVTPDQALQAFQSLQQMDANPEALYDALGTFLKENGRLSETATEVAEVTDNADAEETEYDSPEAKQIAELQGQLKTLLDNQAKAAEEAKQAQVAAETEKAVEAEYSAFREAHKDLTEDDMKTITRLHYADVVSGGNRPLEEVGKEYFDLVSRIQSAPRPNDSAPRLPGAGGAAPAPQAKDPSTFSSQESQEAMIALLRANRDQS